MTEKRPMYFETIKPGEWTAEDLRWLMPKKAPVEYPGAEVVAERLESGELLALRGTGPARGLVLLEREGPYLNIFWMSGRGVLRNLPLMLSQLRSIAQAAGYKLKGYVENEQLAAKLIAAGASIRRYEMEL